MNMDLIRLVVNRGVHFRFGSVFIKKNNQTEFKKKLKLVLTDRFRIGFLEQKPVQTSLAWFFGLARFFFRFFSVWVRSGSVFSVLCLKNRTSWFFQNFNRFNWFFFMVRFFQLICCVFFFRNGGYFLINVHSS